jgi:exodeoxyribonuclease-3
VSLAVATWNVNGIRARQEQFLEWLGRERPGIVCLQEIKAPPEKLAAELCDLPGYWCRWHGAGGYSGVGLHLARDLFPEPPAFHHPPFDRESRVAAVDLGELVVASVYVPNGGRDFAGKLAFLEALGAWAAALRAAGKRLLLCGDLNVARGDMDIHPKERKPNQIGARPDERQRFEALLARGGLVDLGRALDPENDRLYTWWAPWRNLRQRNIGWRIDYVLASEPLAATATACRVQADVGSSDHAPVAARVAR